jgi:hypothetical protein
MELPSVEKNKNNISHLNRNYWKEEEEQILREWADKAQCYELMNAKSHAIYNSRNTFFVIPVIIISTLTGTANFAQDRVPTQYLNLFVMLVGGLNILAGIITTISQYLKIAELNESYRVGALQWGKFYRNIKMELVKHPLDRMDPATMLSMCKEEFDRLLEIYPNIPKKVIAEFNKQFSNDTEIAKPEICDIIEPTVIFPMSKEERLEMIKQITMQNDSEEDNDEEEKNEIIELVEEKPEVKIDPEVMHKIDKYKQTFYKINGCYPSENEIKETMQTFLNDSKIDIGQSNHQDSKNSNNMNNMNNANSTTLNLNYDSDITLPDATPV